MTVPKGANPLADFGFGPAVPKKAEEKRAKPAPAPAPAVEDSESDDTDGSRGGSWRVVFVVVGRREQDEAANVVDEPNAKTKTKIAKTKTARPASSSAAMPSASKKKTNSTALSGKPRPATATATVSGLRAAPPKPKLPDEAKGFQRFKPMPSRRRESESADALESAPAVTPMQALLNRTLGVVVPSGGDRDGKKGVVSGAEKGAARVFQAVKGVVFLQNKTPIEEEEAEDEMDEFFDRSRVRRSKASAAIAAAAARRAVTRRRECGESSGAPARPGTPPRGSARLRTQPRTHRRRRRRGARRDGRAAERSSQGGARGDGDARSQGAALEVQRGAARAGAEAQEGGARGGGCDGR